MECNRCGKQYNSKAWLTRHEKTCDKMPENKSSSKKKQKKPAPSDSGSDSDSEPARDIKKAKGEFSEHKESYQSHLSELDNNIIIEEGPNMTRTFTISKLGYIRTETDNDTDIDSEVEDADAHPNRWNSLYSGVTSARAIKQVFESEVDALETLGYEEVRLFSCSPRPGTKDFDINALLKGAIDRFDSDEEDSFMFEHEPVVKFFKGLRESLSECDESEKPADNLEKRFRKLHNFCDIKYARGDDGHSPVDVFYHVDSEESVISGCIVICAF
eukprot:TRINITY_DN9722_c0_g1_i1.p1 TRINITY_DN9722_c0_g1~~TRINITY_DN9722_c0_g1_i1.p1  ORF type:complete len:272 (+),score=47.21 TRINITY_DN9722_c0_g1_i1:134-949(+)